MTNSEQAIREIAEAEYPDMPGISERAPYNQIMATNRTNLIARITALISEHYYPKEFVRWKDNHYHCVASLYWEKQPERSDKTFRQIPHFTIDELFNYWRENER